MDSTGDRAYSYVYEIHLSVVVLELKAFENVVICMGEKNVTGILGASDR